MKINKKLIISILAAGGMGLSAASSSFASGTLESVMKARNLTQKDLLAAAKNYTPSC